MKAVWATMYHYAPQSNNDKRNVLVFLEQGEQLASEAEARTVAGHHIDNMRFLHAQGVCTGEMRLPIVFVEVES